MSTVICQHFVQNTWKKDLCSNCFKAREEHHPAVLNGYKSRYSLLNNIINGNSQNPPVSIMKTDKLKIKSKKQKSTVQFPKDESEVIGYGGEEWSSDTEDFELSEESPDDDIHLIADSETERELQRITKSNTDFNTNNANLLGETSVSETRRVFANLMLGKSQTDSDGKRQTLHIQVTPFGGQESPGRNKTTPIKSSKNKELLTDNCVRLTSYSSKTDVVDSPVKDEKSLLDEINETLEKNKTNLLLKPIKNETKSKCLEKNKENVVPTKDSNSEYIKTKAECIFINGDGGTDKKIDTVRKNGLTRHPAIKRDQEKPVVHQKEKEDNKLIEATSPMLVKTELRFIQSELMTLKTDETSRKIDGNVRFEETAERVLGLPPISPTKYSENDIFDVEASRELAGEPDGRADPDVSPEPPALPLTPPPIMPDPRPSFLHSPSKKQNDKPKVPAKPNKILPKPPVKVTPPDTDNSDNVSTDSVNENTYESLPIKTPLNKQDSNGSNDMNRNPNKRRAPKPPMTNNDDCSPGGTKYQRNNVSNVKHDSPVVREKEKRERASSCSPKFRNNNSSPTPIGGDSTPNLTIIPEPAPRRSLSLSQDNLLPNGSICDRSEEKKKHRARFSLKKFLRMGNNREIEKNLLNQPVYGSKTDDNQKYSAIPQPKPRLVIVHPTELNGSSVEVVIRSETDSKDEISSRPCKPPPPPRNHTDERNIKSPRPLPPKNDELIRQQQKFWNNNNGVKPNSPKENIYANVGEVRAVLTPSKPVRTASMREREAAALYDAQKRNQTNKQPIEHNYEQVEIRIKDANSENMYDFVNGQRSSSPECDSSLGKESPPLISMNNKRLITPRKTDSTILMEQHHHHHHHHSPDYMNKFHLNGFVRTTSMPYCGSETESEIYSPYSFYGSETDANDDDSEWSNSGARTYRLRSRKGRSIVHKNLEDNYGAVIVANHEALAQVLEHMHQTNTVQPALRGLKTAPNLRWSDFSIMDSSTNNPNSNNSTNFVHIGRRCFHTALWGSGSHHVTLALTLEQGSMLQTNPLSPLAPYTLVPITEFSDLVPINCLPMTTITDSKNNEIHSVQVTIAVLPWMQVDTIQSMGCMLRAKFTQQPINSSTSTLGSVPNAPPTEELYFREACFVLLQLINGLKCLQAQGIEELPLTLTSFALCREIERDTHPRLCVLQGLSEEFSRVDQQDSLGSLCECALTALKQLLPSTSLTSLLEDLLRRERAISLTQVKSVLEFTLWGPSDVALTTPIKDRELALQRWLDLERATVLHGLVRTRVQLTVFEECHLMFLVRSTAKMMCEASLLLDSILPLS